MTIKVSKDGYLGTAVPGHGLLLIDGVLHRSVVPTNSSREVWIPVRCYDGPVERVDRRGRPVTAPAPATSGVHTYRGLSWSDELEDAARKIYQGLSHLKGHVPWTPGGDNAAQNEARDLVWRTVTASAGERDDG